MLEVSNDTINERGRDDYTPLHVAIINRDIASVKNPLQHGADSTLWFPRCEVKFAKESISVTEAADLGFVDTLKLLVETGGPVPSVTFYNSTDSGQLNCIKEIFT